MKSYIHTSEKYYIFIMHIYKMISLRYGSIGMSVKIICQNISGDYYLIVKLWSICCPISFKPYNNAYVLS